MNGALTVTHAGLSPANSVFGVRRQLGNAEEERVAGQKSVKQWGERNEKRTSAGLGEGEGTEPSESEPGKRAWIREGRKAGPRV